MAKRDITDILAEVATAGGLAAASEVTRRDFFADFQAAAERRREQSRASDNQRTILTSAIKVGAVSPDAVEDLGGVDTLAEEDPEVFQSTFKELKAAQTRTAGDEQQRAIVTAQLEARGTKVDPDADLNDLLAMAASQEEEEQVAAQDASNLDKFTNDTDLVLDEIAAKEAVTAADAERAAAAVADFGQQVGGLEHLSAENREAALQRQKRMVARVREFERRAQVTAAVQQAEQGADAAIAAFGELPDGTLRERAKKRGAMAVTFSRGSEVHSYLRSLPEDQLEDTGLRPETLAAAREARSFDELARTDPATASALLDVNSGEVQQRVTRGAAERAAAQTTQDLEAMVEAIPDDAAPLFPTADVEEGVTVSTNAEGNFVVSELSETRFLRDLTAPTRERIETASLADLYKMRGLYGDITAQLQLSGAVEDAIQQRILGATEDEVAAADVAAAEAVEAQAAEGLSESASVAQTITTIPRAGGTVLFGPGKRNTLAGFLRAEGRGRELSGIIRAAKEATTPEQRNQVLQQAFRTGVLDPDDLSPAQREALVVGSEFRPLREVRSMVFDPSALQRDQDRLTSLQRKQAALSPQDQPVLAGRIAFAQQAVEQRFAEQEGIRFGIAALEGAAGRIGEGDRDEPGIERALASALADTGGGLDPASIAGLDAYNTAVSEDASALDKAFAFETLLRANQGLLARKRGATGESTTRIEKGIATATDNLGALFETIADEVPEDAVDDINKAYGLKLEKDNYILQLALLHLTDTTTLDQTSNLSWISGR